MFTRSGFRFQAEDAGSVLHTFGTDYYFTKNKFTLQAFVQIETEVEIENNRTETEIEITSII